MRDIRNILSVLLLLGLSYSQASVTFQVDMQGQTVHENGVYLMGGPWHSNPQAMEAPDQGETIWSLTLSTDPDGAALSGDYMYKFSNGGDSDYYEQIPDACAHGTYGDRMVTVGSDDIVLPPVLWGSCDIALDVITVTFHV